MKKNSRKINYEEALTEQIELMDLGPEIMKFTDWHWRIDNEIDVWPSKKKYMKNYIVKNYQHLKDVL